MSPQDLTDTKYRSESSLRELALKLSTLEEEHRRCRGDVVSSRREVGRLEGVVGGLETSAAQSRTRLAVLDQELKVFPLPTISIFLTSFASYILTYLHSYILTYLHTYILTYLRTYILTYLHTYILTYLHTYEENPKELNIVALLIFKIFFYTSNSIFFLIGNFNIK